MRPEMKICSKCKVDKPAEDFHRNSSKKDGLQSQCKACKSTTDSVDYKVHARREEVKARTVRQRLRLRAWVTEYLAQKACVDCGNVDSRVLEFDHVRGVKRDSIANMVRFGVGLSTLVDEVAKCEVRCANCHRIRTRQTLWDVGELVDPPGSDPGDIAGSKPAVPAMGL